MVAEKVKISSKRTVHGSAQERRLHGAERKAKVKGEWAMQHL